MTELEKYELVNSAETTDELKQAILTIADENGNIKGRSQFWPAEKQVRGIDSVLNFGLSFNVLTRSYGIRQQLMYLIHYNLISINGNTETDNKENKSY